MCIDVLRRVALFPIAVSIVFLAGCSPFSTYYRTAPGADFTRLATYRWENSAAAAAPLTEHITGAVEEQLALLGYEKSSKPAVDFLIAYRLIINDMRVTYRIDMGPRYDVPLWYYYRTHYPAREWLTEYCYVDTIRKVGFFNIYALDPRTKLVLWQGVAEDVFDEYASPLQNLQIQRYAAIELMKNFPHRQKK